MVVRPTGESSNGAASDFGGVDPEELFTELERWEEVLRPYAEALRGPRR